MKFVTEHFQFPFQLLRISLKTNKANTMRGFIYGALKAEPSQFYLAPSTQHVQWAYKLKNEEEEIKTRNGVSKQSSEQTIRRK